MADNEIRIRITVKDEQAQKKLREFGQRMEEMGSKVGMIGGVISRYVTLPITGMFAAAIAGSEDLQAALTPIKEDFQGLAKELGNSLIPVVKDLMPDIQRIIGFVGDLVHKFTELDTDSKKRILGVAAAIASIGPALMIMGQLFQFIGALANIGSVLGVGVGVGGAATGGVGAAVAGGGVTAAVTGFGAALTGVIAPMAAVIGLAIVLYKWLDKIGAIKAAGQTIKDLGGIARYAIGSTVAGADPGKLNAYVTGGMTGLQNYSNPQAGTPTSNSGLTYPNVARYSGGQPITVNVSAPNVVGTQKELAAVMKPAIYEAFRQLGLSGAK